MIPFPADTAGPSRIPPSSRVQRIRGVDWLELPRASGHTTLHLFQEGHSSPRVLRRESTLSLLGLLGPRPLVTCVHSSREPGPGSLPGAAPHLFRTPGAT